MRNRIIALITLTVLTVFPVAGVQAAEEDATIEFVGAGFGHGRGMSQYGAYARVEAGQTRDQVLLSYYTDEPNTAVSTLGEAGIPSLRNVFVSVDSDSTFTRLTVSDGGGTGTAMTITHIGLDPGMTADLSANDTVDITFKSLSDGTRDGCTTTLTVSGVVTEWDVDICDFDITLQSQQGLPQEVVSATNCRTVNCTFGFGTVLHIVDNNSPQRTVGGVHYPDRIGTFGEIYPGFDLVVEATLDDYTRGIAEVPFGWPAAALEAQAVAARSYAASYVAATEYLKKGCFCDLLNDATRQVYAGWLGGRVLWSEWDDAALATNGVVLTHPEAPDGGFIRAEYSSSNGGISEQGYDNSLNPLAYMQPVPDSPSLAPQNPYRSWTTTVPAGTIENALWSGAKQLRYVDIEDASVSGKARMVRFTAADGSTESRTPSWISSVIGSTATCTKADGNACASSASPFPSWYFDALFGGPPPPPSGPGSIGIQDPRTGIWTLRFTDGSTSQFYYGDPDDIPFIGDWNGNGIETVGLYRKSVGFLFLRYTNTQGIADVDIYYGIPGDLPIAGDWNGDGTDTIGIYRPSEARFYLRNTNTQGIADVDMAFGDVGDVPIAGDWDGDGIDTIGVYRPSTKMVYLTNSVPDGGIDVTFDYAGTVSGDRILAGDWNNDGFDTLGVFRPSNATFYLRDTFTQSSANISFSFGDWWMNPVAGFWGG